ncbi:enoyl-CoA hydratase/isomerase family protein [Planococcus sp. ISL-109]|nr:enoyl-CoA hydratase/isomerase family protein [Planococcus sp. ISL-109]
MGVITIDHQPLNVLSDAVLGELEKAIAAIHDSDMRAVVLRSASDKAFAAGADISQFPELTKMNGIELVEKGKRIFDKLTEGKAPVICAVHGLALGAGLELALACDIRIAEKTAKLGLPETGLGILPGYGGTQRLSRLVGPGKAKELVLSGVWLDGKEAYEARLVERVVPAGRAFEEAYALAGNIAAKGPLAVAYAKEAIDEGLDLSFSEAQFLETRMFAKLIGTSDMAEGVQAFIEKRKPGFIGK